MRIKNVSVLKNQSGAALVIALTMMVVLTLIGLASIFSSNFEMKISGNKRGSTNAFYGAESGLQVLEANINNFNPVAHVYPYNPFTDAANVNPNPTSAQAIITYDTAQQGAPRGFGFSAINFEFEHFLIASTGRDQTDINLIPSRTTLEEKLIRLIPTQQGGY